jgi:hypothetical protein
MRRDNRWCRSKDHRGGWAWVDSGIPLGLVKVPPGKYKRWKAIKEIRKDVREVRREIRKEERRDDRREDRNDRGGGGGKGHGRGKK